MARSPPGPHSGQDLQGRARLAHQRCTFRGPGVRGVRVLELHRYGHANRGAIAPSPVCPECVAWMLTDLFVDAEELRGDAPLLLDDTVGQEAAMPLGSRCSALIRAFSSWHCWVSARASFASCW